MLDLIYHNTEQH